MSFVFAQPGCGRTAADDRYGNFRKVGFPLAARFEAEKPLLWKTHKFCVFLPDFDRFSPPARRGFVENPVENVENQAASDRLFQVILGNYVYRILLLVVAAEEVSFCNFSGNLPKAPFSPDRKFRFRSGIFAPGLI